MPFEYFWWHLDIFGGFLAICGCIWIFFGKIWIFVLAFWYLLLRCEARRWRTCSRKCKYRSLRPTLPRIRPLAKKTAGASLKLCFRKIFSIVDKMTLKICSPNYFDLRDYTGKQNTSSQPWGGHMLQHFVNFIELQFVYVNISKVIFLVSIYFMRKPVSQSSTLQNITFYAVFYSPMYPCILLL